jgi:enterochelin esterase-like enzyme
MRESVLQLNSSYLQNERSIWICESVSGASDLVVFLDAEVYRDRMDALSVIEEVRGQVADAWYVFVSHQTWETRWCECPCYPPFAGFIGEELLTWLASGYIDFKRIRRRALAGVSYTGLAAAFVAKAYPGSFQRIISQSGSFWWKDCWLVEQFRRLGQKIPANSTWTLARRKFMKTSVIRKNSFRLYRRSKASGASETHYSLRAMRCDIRSSTEVTTTRVGMEP